jgi:ANTAR domain
LEFVPMTGDPSAEAVADIAGRFRAAWANASDAATARPELLPVRLARACTAVLPVDGAGLSVIDRDFRVPLGASDEMTTLAERLQFTHGEGPCLDAANDQHIQVGDPDVLYRSWPMFAQDLEEHTPFRAILALPLQISDTMRGALDLFFVDPGQIRAVSLADATTISDRIVEALAIARAVTGTEAPAWSDEPEPAWLLGPAAEDRALVWVAIGMAMTRFDLTAQDALALLRSYSYGEGTVLDTVAAAVVNGDLDLAELQP